MRGSRGRGGATMRGRLIRRKNSDIVPLDSARPDLTLGIVGTGVMGRGIAQIAAQAGIRVVLYDTREGSKTKGEINEFFMGEQNPILLVIPPLVLHGMKGIGIEPAYHDKVFGVFEKLHAGTEGAGMGLAIVKRILEARGGRIWIESSGEGAGATICFTLPGEPAVAAIAAAGGKR